MSAGTAARVGSAQEVARSSGSAEGLRKYCWNHTAAMSSSILTVRFPTQSSLHFSTAHNKSCHLHQIIYRYLDPLRLPEYSQSIIMLASVKAWEGWSAVKSRFHRPSKSSDAEGIRTRREETGMHQLTERNSRLPRRTDVISAHRSLSREEVREEVELTHLKTYTQRDQTSARGTR